MSLPVALLAYFFLYLGLACWRCRARLFPGISPIQEELVELLADLDEQLTTKGIHVRVEKSPGLLYDAAVYARGFVLLPVNWVSRKAPALHKLRRWLLAGPQPVGRLRPSRNFLVGALAWSMLCQVVETEFAVPEAALPLNHQKSRQRLRVCLDGTAAAITKELSFQTTPVRPPLVPSSVRVTFKALMSLILDSCTTCKLPHILHERLHSLVGRRATQARSAKAGGEDGEAAKVDGVPMATIQNLRVTDHSRQRQCPAVGCTKLLEDFSNGAVLTLSLTDGSLSRYSRCYPSNRERKKWLQALRASLDGGCSHASFLLRLGVVRNSQTLLKSMMLEKRSVLADVDVNGHHVELDVAAWLRCLGTKAVVPTIMPQASPQDPYRSLAPLLAGLGGTRRGSRSYRQRVDARVTVTAVREGQEDEEDEKAEEAEAEDRAAPQPGWVVVKPKALGDHWASQGRGNGVLDAITESTTATLLEAVASDTSEGHRPDMALALASFTNTTDLADKITLAQSKESMKALAEELWGTFDDRRASEEDKGALSASSSVPPLSGMASVQRSLNPGLTLDQLIGSSNLHHLHPATARHGSVAVECGPGSVLARELAHGVVSGRVVPVGLDPGSRFHELAVVVTKQMLDVGAVEARPDDPAAPFIRTARISASVGRDFGVRASMAATQSPGMLGAMAANAEYDQAGSSAFSALSGRLSLDSLAAVASAVCCSSLAGVRSSRNFGVERAWQHVLCRALNQRLGVSSGEDVSVVLFYGASDFDVNFNTRPGGLYGNVGNVAVARAAATLPQVGVVHTNEFGTSACCACCGGPLGHVVRGAKLPRTPGKSYWLSSAVTADMLRPPGARSRKLLRDRRLVKALDGCVFLHERQLYAMVRLGADWYAARIRCPRAEVQHWVDQGLWTAETLDKALQAAELTKDNLVRVVEVRVAPMAQQPACVLSAMADRQPRREWPMPNLVFDVENLPFHSIRVCQPGDGARSCPLAGKKQSRDASSARFIHLMGLHSVLVGTVGYGLYTKGREYRVVAGVDSDMAASRSRRKKTAKALTRIPRMRAKVASEASSDQPDDEAPTLEGSPSDTVLPTGPGPPTEGLNMQET